MKFALLRDAKPVPALVPRLVLLVALILFAKSISTIESLTTTPDNATRPNIVKIVSGIPIAKCPQIAPTIPNGVTASTNNGCR